ncbi:hypothetical protein K438DRAFT_1949225 [Mycena galopus ATCC 62051]|nr:hypothetical protein K438DRAFT_1949225 [Mycena galopus ATCC 62051]
MGALGLGRVCGRLLNLDASYRTVFKVTHEEVTGREFLAKGVGCYVGSKFAALCSGVDLFCGASSEHIGTSTDRKVAPDRILPFCRYHCHRREEISAGINCEGSLKCNGQPHDTAKVLVGYINGIDSGRYYDNGEHIACRDSICAFLQGAPGRCLGAYKECRASTFGAWVHRLWERTTGPNNDDSGGQLTFNFRKESSPRQAPSKGPSFHPSSLVYKIPALRKTHVARLHRLHLRTNQESRLATTSLSIVVSGWCGTEEKSNFPREGVNRRSGTSCGLQIRPRETVMLVKEGLPS